MKISYFLSIPTIIAFAAAETMVLPAHDLNVASTPIVSNIVPAAAAIISTEDAQAEITHDHGRPSSSGFTAWSSPGLKGHKQRTKNTPGCYKLDGGAVGSFEGDSNTQYAFYGDLRCSQKMLFASNTAPVRRIDPIIYPRSVKMLKSGGGDGNVNRYSLITWSRPDFAGDNEKYRGMGCINLDGSVVMSFQGDLRYRFYPGPRCQGPMILESRGGMSSHKRMNPRSAFITR
ncbi:hypothetical protein EC957_003099 [Mortierella hygrophila]|uniref:Uncharacterized protein n=1 Tax=Mortierella hygrophila TaxID=979708 RepID=A0A9P6F475_9FUNG|nr:hypothetical protein EC957_003099 [Mortierella hygrophila]